MSKKELLEFKPRRVQLQHGAYMVTLPQEWCYHHQIEKRHILRVTIDEDTRLVLEPVADDIVEHRL